MIFSRLHTWNWFLFTTARYVCHNTLAIIDVVYCIFLIAGEIFQIHSTCIYQISGVYWKCSNCSSESEQMCSLVVEKIFSSPYIWQMHLTKVVFRERFLISILCKIFHYRQVKVSGHCSVSVKLFCEEIETIRMKCSMKGISSGCM